MKNWRRWTAAVLAGMMAAGLTACGGAGAPAGTTEAGGASTTKAESEAKAGENKGAEGDKVTLEFYAWLDEEGIFTKLTEEYKKDHPNVDFNLHFVPTNDYET